MIQASIFDFKPREIIRTVKLETSKWSDSGFIEVYRSDAQSYVDSLFQLPNGRACTDERLLLNDFHNDPVKGHYFHSGVERDQEHPFYSFIQRAGIGCHKLIGDGDIQEWISFREYDPDAHNYKGDYESVDTAYIEDDVLHIVSTKGHEKAFRIVGDDECDRYERSKWDPAYYTENFCIECLRHGASCDDLDWYTHNYAYALECYKPFVRDYRTGRIAESKTFDKIMELARMCGIIPKIPYGPMRPAPTEWDIYPAYQKNYCRNAKGCKQKSDSMGCCGCNKYVYNGETVKASHQSRPDTVVREVKRKAKACDFEECEDGEDE